MSSPVRENPEKAAAAAKRLSDALLADPAVAERFDRLFAETAARPLPDQPDDIKSPPQP
jgi:hypothetical protein